VDNFAAELRYSESRSKMHSAKNLVLHQLAPGESRWVRGHFHSRVAEEW